MYLQLLKCFNVYERAMLQRSAGLLRNQPNRKSSYVEEGQPILWKRQSWTVLWMVDYQIGSKIPNKYLLVVNHHEMKRQIKVTNILHFSKRS